MPKSSSYRSQCPYGSHSTAEKQELETPFFGKDAAGPRAQSGNTPFFQTKLNIGQPGDPYEREADTVANKIVQQKSSGTVVQQKEISSIQRLASSKEEEKLGTNEERMRRDKEIQTKPDIQQKCDACEKEKEGAVQKKENGGHAASASPELSNQISSSAGKGQALPKETLGEMQSSFGTDFSRVNIHTGSDAIEMNNQLGAQAFTHGNDIYFNSGKYDPGTSQGKHLLAHELTHVVQQSGGGEKVQQKMDDGHNLHSHHFSGDMRLEEAYDGNTAMYLRTGSSGESVVRVQAFLVEAGYPLPQYGVDGMFGQETYQAVVAFQNDNGLEYIDGIVGRETLGTMDNYATSCPLSTEGENCEYPGLQLKPKKDTPPPKKPTCKDPKKCGPVKPPKKEEKKGGKSIDVDTTRQVAIAKEGDKVVKEMPISSGKASTPTDEGHYTVHYRDADHKSSESGKCVKKDGSGKRNVESRTSCKSDEKFEGSPMPNYVQFNWKAGEGFHEGKLPGGAASHGCVRLNPADAKWMYNWAANGTKVHVFKKKDPPKKDPPKKDPPKGKKPPPPKPKKK